MSNTAKESRPTAEEMPALQLPYPARQSDMVPAPDTDLSSYRAAGKLENKVAIITGADSGIGRAVAIAFAMEGANVAIVYNENDGDAQTTRGMVEERGRRCLVLKRDVRDRAACQSAVEETVQTFGGLNLLVNNAAYQMAQKEFSDITEEQFRRTLETNLFGYFHMAQAALPHLKKGDAIINSGSIVGMVGNELLVDYCASKGGIHAFTKALALNLAPKGIRVNCVAPGPVWTPNIPATMPVEEVEQFGHEVAMGRPGQPEELAPAYVYLASDGDSSFVTGIILEVTGGKLSSG
ncbi:MAG: glucose 1-dehydrogenase [Armatimonadota bacterium]